jgi:mannose-6-phosphate isomerase-like protein (cupin superfamily)
MIPSADPRMTIADHSIMPPTVSESTRRAWITRGQNFAIEISRVEAGAVLARENQSDEYMVLLADVGAQVVAGAESIEAPADSLLIVPPGASRLTAAGDGLIVRVFSAKAADMLAAAANQAPYREPRADIAPLVTWPAPKGGYRLRCYRMDDYVKAGSKMRIFRCQHLMINVLTRRDKARDIHAMSPHSHADFEQGSTSLWGTFEHHLRWPWGADMAAWRADEHPRLGAPSVTIMAPGVIHTSNNVGDVPAWLIDVFAPPRMDFSSKPGNVCNEDEYPMP